MEVIDGAGSCEDWWVADDLSIYLFNQSVIWFGGNEQLCMGSYG